MTANLNSGVTTETDEKEMKSSNRTIRAKMFDFSYEVA